MNIANKNPTTETPSLTQRQLILQKSISHQLAMPCRRQVGDISVVTDRVLSISSFGRRNEEEKDLVRRARARWVG